MDGCRQREVVLEIEQVKLVRKRAKTSLSSCRGCGRATDFILLTDAAGLFGVSCVEVFDFTTSNHCHFVVGSGGDIYICLVALLEAMGQKARSRRFKLLDAE
jgi:hypothetical protein